MIDGLFKKYIDPLWEMPARPLSRVFTANQVTLMGLGLIAVVSLAYVWHKAPFIYALTLAIAFSADSLDGAVARLRGESSAFGSYLDAVVDRFLTSYMKARAAMEMPVDNVAWPDLFERQERIFFICLALVCQSLFAGSFDLMPWALWLLAILTHVTAAQRFLRARKLLKDRK